MQLMSPSKPDERRVTSPKPSSRHPVPAETYREEGYVRISRMNAIDRRIEPASFDDQFRLCAVEVTWSGWQHGQADIATNTATAKTTTHPKNAMNTE
jgi:hypothetical protein